MIDCGVSHDKNRQNIPNLRNRNSADSLVGGEMIKAIEILQTLLDEENCTEFTDNYVQHAIDEIENHSFKCRQVERERDSYRDQLNQLARDMG